MIQYLSFCDWFISLSISFLTSSHSVACIRIPFIFWGWIIFHRCVYAIFCLSLHFSMCKESEVHLQCSCFLFVQSTLYAGRLSITDVSIITSHSQIIPLWTMNNEVILWGKLFKYLHVSCNWSPIQCKFRSLHHWSAGGACQWVVFSQMKDVEMNPDFQAPGWIAYIHCSSGDQINPSLSE